MGFIRAILNTYQQKVQARNLACEQLISCIDNALKDAEVILSQTGEFVDPLVETLWQGRHQKTLLGAQAEQIKHLRKASRYKQLSVKQEELIRVATSITQDILRHNEQAADMRVGAARALIGNVEKRELDRQQLVCIVKEARNHLVIAGAGTGKTTTIIGKIKYLLKMARCKPQEILVLSFTNASATEMSNRIAKEIGYDVEVLTFHKLGLNIISQVDGTKPNITSLNLHKFIREQIELNMQSESYRNTLNLYLLCYRVTTKSEFEFNSQEEYDEYLKLNPPTTVNGETVKSYGEMDVANFLTQHGIRYLYEHPYEVDTRTDEHSQYRPDFFLPDYGIYIEYFGINRDGEVPSYFRSTNKHTSATEAYHSSMEWKRRTHHDNHTTMIECYAYERLEGSLFDRLKEQLEGAGVDLVTKSLDELWAQTTTKRDELLNGVVTLLETIINLMRNNGYDIAKLRELNNIGPNARQNNLLILLIEPVFEAYCQYLLAHQEIDFSDMINLASEYILQGRYIHPYKYVLVDEYQDISKSRFALLKCLRESKDYNLFCVGDDWQSIYRFAGSDIGLLLNFSNHWGATEISKIESTYRFSQELAEISGNFIMRNSAQIRKSIYSQADSIGFFPLGEILGYTVKYAIKFMAERIRDLPKGSSVLLLGRYSFDAKLLEDGVFSSQYCKDGNIKLRLTSRPDLKITFMTIHKAKGLQADYVFIINNKGTGMGFPSKIQDAPILDLLLDNYDQYPYAEERRLFYVALTRAKKKVYLVTIKDQESEFVAELKEQYGREIKMERYECPACGGKLVKRSGPFGEFLGCSNYHTKGCLYKRKLPTR